MPRKKDMGNCIDGGFCKKLRYTVKVINETPDRDQIQLARISWEISQLCVERNAKLLEFDTFMEKCNETSSRSLRDITMNNLSRELYDLNVQVAEKKRERDNLKTLMSTGSIPNDETEKACIHNDCFDETERGGIRNEYFDENEKR